MDFQKFEDNKNLLKKINIHVFPKKFVVVMMHNCKAMF